MKNLMVVSLLSIVIATSAFATVFSETRVIVNDSNASDLALVDVKLPGLFSQDIQVVVSQNDLIKITASLESDISEANAQYFELITTDLVAGTLTLAGDATEFSCQRQEQNNRREVRGVCVSRLIIELPRNKNVLVKHQNRIVHGNIVSQDMLLQELSKMGFHEQKLQLVRRYVEQKSRNSNDTRIFNMSELAAILNAYSFAFDSQRIEIVNLFSGRMIDRQNAALIGAYFSWANTREQAIELAAR